MPEEVIFKSEQVQTRSDIAEILTAVADNLASGEAITIRAGDDSITLDPPQQLTFEIKAEREGPVDGSGELSIEFELEWDENDGTGDGPIEVE